ncbi:hypothetical protein CYMTET_49390 [Cymbomonas tetramitiformis]|uniref:Uncharacterized protein n=1 Tax=Cymbomonas tetramitiformis TaxID=36881 RepID=A0AAE0BQD5_9CHLO|nr:hypothetical protein CYMTET_49390 [Cymbomonas tetramitiformis]
MAFISAYAMSLTTQIIVLLVYSETSLSVSANQNTQKFAQRTQDAFENELRQEQNENDGRLQFSKEDHLDLYEVKRQRDSQWKLHADSRQERKTVDSSLHGFSVRRKDTHNLNNLRRSLDRQKLKDGPSSTGTTPKELPSYERHVGRVTSIAQFRDRLSDIREANAREEDTSVDPAATSAVPAWNEDGDEDIRIHDHFSSVMEASSVPTHQDTRTAAEQAEDIRQYFTDFLEEKISVPTIDPSQDEGLRIRNFFSNVLEVSAALTEDRDGGTHRAPSAIAEPREAPAECFEGESCVEIEAPEADDRVGRGAGDDVDDGSDPARTLQRRREEEDAAIRLKLETDPLLHGRWVHFPAIDEKWQYVAGVDATCQTCLTCGEDFSCPKPSGDQHIITFFGARNNSRPRELLEALNSDFMWRTTSDRGLRRGWCTRSVAAQWCTSQIGGDEGVLSKQLDSLEAVPARVARSAPSPAHLGCDRSSRPCPLHFWVANPASSALQIAGLASGVQPREVGGEDARLRGGAPQRALHANRTHVKAMMDTNRRQHTAWDAHMADVDAFQARLQWEREALDASESELRSRERALNESWQVQLQELEAEGTRLQQEFEEAEEQESQAHWVYADQLKLVKAQRVNQTLTALQLRREKLEEAGSLERESRKEESTVMLLQKEMHVEEQEAVVQSGAREHYELLNRMKDVLAVNRSRLNTKDKNIMDARNAEMLEGVIMDAGTRLELQHRVDGMLHEQEALLPDGSSESSGPLDEYAPPLTGEMTRREPLERAGTCEPSRFVRGDRIGGCWEEEWQSMEALMQQRADKVAHRAERRTAQPPPAASMDEDQELEKMQDLRGRTLE